jgi:hypothetical protein
MLMSQQHTKHLTVFAERLQCAGLQVLIFIVFAANDGQRSKLAVHLPVSNFSAADAI